MNDNTFENFEIQLITQKITIQVQKRNNRQCFTVITGWESDLDLVKICSFLKKKLNCGGNIIKDENHGEVMTLTGDQKKNVYDFLIEQEIYKAEDIILKGI